MKSEMRNIFLSNWPAMLNIQIRMLLKHAYLAGDFTRIEKKQGAELRKGAFVRGLPLLWHLSTVLHFESTFGKVTHLPT